MKSKTRIEKQTKRKENPEIVDTIIAAKKASANAETWEKVAEEISSPRKKQIAINLDKISETAENMEKGTILVPGKVLSMGSLNSKGDKGNKKLKIAALKFSEGAKEKLLNSNYEILDISEEIKNNPKGEELKIIK